MPDKEIKNKLNETFGKKNKNYSKLYSDSTAQQIMDAKFQKAMSTAHLVDTTGQANFLKNEAIKKKQRDAAFKASQDSIINERNRRSNMKTTLQYETLIGKNASFRQKKYKGPGGSKFGTGDIPNLPK